MEIRVLRIVNREQGYYCNSNRYASSEEAYKQSWYAMRHYVFENYRIRQRQIARVFP